MRLFTLTIYLVLWIDKLLLIICCFRVSERVGEVGWSRLITVIVFEVVIEYNIVVILGQIIWQVEVLFEEADQFWRRSIVGQLSRMRISLPPNHCIEEGLSVTATLNLLRHVEVKDTQGFHFDDTTTAISHEQLFRATLYETNTLGRPLHFEVHSVIICTQLPNCGNRWWQFLGLKYTR